jgi:hypothetical protein
MQNQSFDRPSNIVIACTLSAADLQDRQEAWSKVGKYIGASGRIPGGLSFEFTNATGVAESLAELVRLEAECCAWMSFAATDSPDRIRLEITGAGPDGERGVRESFAPLIRG